MVQIDRLYRAQLLPEVVASGTCCLRDIFPYCVPGFRSASPGSVAGSCTHLNTHTQRGGENKCFDGGEARTGEGSVLWGVWFTSRILRIRPRFREVQTLVNPERS